MKKITFIMLFSGAIFAQAAAPQEPTPQHFDHSVELFREALQSGNTALAEHFFADSVAYERDDGRTVFIPGSLVLSALEADLNGTMSAEDYLLVVSKGFSEVPESMGNCYINVHSGLHQPELIKVTSGPVNFRKLPSTDSNILCLLDNGVYSGVRDQSRMTFTDQQSGISWIPLRIYHPSLGSVRGYVASDLVTIQQKHVPRAMTVQFINQEWKIVALTGFESMLCAQ